MDEKRPDAQVLQRRLEVRDPSVDVAAAGGDEVGPSRPRSGVASSATPLGHALGEFCLSPPMLWKVGTGLLLPAA